MHPVLFVIAGRSRGEPGPSSRVASRSLTTDDPSPQLLRSHGYLGHSSLPPPFVFSTVLRFTGSEKPLLHPPPSPAHDRGVVPLAPPLGSQNGSPIEYSSKTGNLIYTQPRAVYVKGTVLLTILQAIPEQKCLTQSIRFTRFRLGLGIFRRYLVEPAAIVGGPQNLAQVFPSLAFVAISSMMRILLNKILLA
ncbi:hypothetical protein GOBAR_AA26595 [Gossypium barbadense]|uniref:Uncharacterized protein n=1 Tax=Gossypium barbadense TaxID=3634 RepID=A0A2P5WSL9_GOSBA|nr:hypothetical protein GOBAR_AA26595 [Gossypium barbadense]